MKKQVLLICLAFVALFASAQKSLHYSELSKYIPDNFESYKLTEEKDGATVDVGGVTFSSVTASYSNGNSELEIALMDYVQATSMFMAQTSVWQTGISIDTNEEKASTIELNGLKGWQVFSKADKEASLILAVHDRYIVSIAVTNSSLSEAKSIAKQMRLSSLPK